MDHSAIETARIRMPLPRVMGLPLVLCLAMWIAAAAPAAAQTTPAPEVDAFIQEMVRKHQFRAGQLRRLLAQAQVRPSIIRAMTAPRTSRPWYEFRAVYVTSERIEGGVAFWQQNAAAIARAGKEYGVPEELIVATIGVETFYGRNTGTFRVLDALTTLAFNYPPRAEYFRRELEEFLLL